jgi:hypothetical protein
MQLQLMINIIFIENVDESEKWHPILITSIDGW